jgi:hypothetical protein
VPIALILEALGGCEQLRIDRGRTDDGADLAHRFADGIEEGPTGVLHQMPAICDLNRVRPRLCRGFAIPSTAVTGDDSDRGMSSEPGLGGRGLTIRQQGDDPAPFQFADDAGVSVIAPPSPIINADNPERVSWGAASAPDHAQERVFAHRQHQPFCEACCRSTAKRQTEVMDDRVQPRRELALSPSKGLLIEGEATIRERIEDADEYYLVEFDNEPGETYPRFIDVQGQGGPAHYVHEINRKIGKA